MPTDVVQPFFTQGVNFLPPVVLARGSVARATYDLTGKVGAFLNFKLGRGGTTALVAGVTPFVSRIINGGVAMAGGMITPLIGPGLSSIAAANGSTVSTNAAAGDYELKTVAITGWAAGDWLCIQDADGGVTRLEFAMIAKLSVVSGTGVTLRSPLAFVHTAAQADTVRNKADVWNEYQVAGGGLISVGFDYSAESASSEAVTVCINGRTYDDDRRVTLT
jgi:hypothetical protein